MPLNLGGLVKFDLTKLDRVKFKTWLIAGAQLLEPAVITPGNMDKLLFDNLDGLIDRSIDIFSKEDGVLIVGDASGLMISGEPPVTTAQVNMFLAKFENVPEASVHALRDNPSLVRKLEKFSMADQKLIVGNPLLLLALQTLLPFLMQILLNRFKG